MGKSIEDCLEAKEWVDLFDAIDVNKKGSLNMKGTITEFFEMLTSKCYNSKITIFVTWKNVGFKAEFEQ